jgi:hypothetical protein
MHASHLNPKDPLGGITPSNAREALAAIFPMFERMGAGEAVANDVAANVIVNALRQTYPTHAEADRKLDELMARVKTILADQYQADGRRRGVFAYDQVINVPHVDLRRPQG